MPRPAELETAIGRPGDVQRQFRSADQVIAELAGRQHGVVARRQLVALGLGREAIAGRCRNGRLHRLHPGVYAVGHRAQTWEGRWMAGLLAAGAKAVLSHRSAASLWRLAPLDRGPVDVTSPRSARSRGLIRRHIGHLPDDEVTTLDGIPVTTASRTLLDLATVLPAHALERAVREAEVLRLPLRPPLAELLDRYPGRRGIGSLRACFLRLGLLSDGVTRSMLEDRFLSLLSRQALPLPETNVRLEVVGLRIEADCLWRGRRVIAELDGYEAHGTRVAFEGDRQRDRRLQAAGWRAIRVTWSQVKAADRLLIEDLKLLLGAGDPVSSVVRDNVQA
jgi:Transcriptional regulator, AbiEi antitoxin